MVKNKLNNFTWNYFFYYLILLIDIRKETLEKRREVEEKAIVLKKATRYFENKKNRLMSNILNEFLRRQ